VDRLITIQTGASIVDKQQIVQLMSERLHLSPAESQALTDGNVYDVAASRFGGDPMMMAILNMMKDRQSRDAPDDPPTRDRTLRVARDPDRDDDLRDLVQAARTTLRYVGQVLGACRCWGKNPSCPSCGGEGGPGFRPSSHPDTYLAWVEAGLGHIGYRAARTEAAVQRNHRLNQEV
jgi:hypothetical protein